MLLFSLFFRGLVHFLRNLILKISPRATLRAVIIGSSKNTEYLADYISAFPESGFTLAGVVAGSKFIPKDLRRKQYSSLKEALRRAKPDVIFPDRRSSYRVCFTVKPSTVTSSTTLFLLVPC